MTDQPDCVKCSETNRLNQHRLEPLLAPITYESAEIITNFSLPRKYTNTHNDETSEIYLSIGHDYNKRMLESEEAVKVQSQVVGKWAKHKSGYAIHFTVIVSSEQNPQAFIRNKIFCEELGVVLEGFGLAETALLKLHPELAKAKIYVHFESIDPAYARVEKWHTLGYWAKPKPKPKPAPKPSSSSSEEKPKKKKKSHYKGRPPPQQPCRMCQR